MPYESNQEMIVTYLSTNSTSSFNRAHLERRIPVGFVRDMCVCVCSHIPRPSQKWKEGVVNGWRGSVHCKMLGLLNLLSLVEPSAEPKATQKFPLSVHN